MNLHSAIRRFASSERALVVADFDGTLAPIVDHPDEAELETRSAEALVRLATLPGVEPVILSGRGYADLTERVGDLPGVTLIGGHGSEADRSATPDDLTEVRARFDRSVARLPGAWIETKHHSLGLHYRAVTSSDLEDELEDLRRWAKSHDVHLLENKRIFEAGVRPLSKGVAVAELRTAVGGGAVFYAGDDATDETVFVTLEPGDIGVKVGDGPTAAAFRVEDIDAVAGVLEDLLAAFGDAGVHPS